MSKDPLARTVVPRGWIDLGIGEARVVRAVFEKTYGLGFDLFEHSTRDELLEYQSPAGFKPLVDHLENLHKAPIIITAGAKQGLCAAFSCLKSVGCQKLGLRAPYWSQLPQAIKSEGLSPIALDDLGRLVWKRDKSPFDCYLTVSPNNPDGHIENATFTEKLIDAHIPLIHDAVYNTKTYSGFSEHSFNSDVEIYSFSKMFGLSGLRVGYCVVRNVDFYEQMLEYIETKTVGVSSISQSFVLSALKREESVRKAFDFSSRAELRAAHAEFERVKDLLSPGHHLAAMFGWYKNVGSVDFDALKIKVMDGKHFGSPGYVRLNLAVGLDTVRRAVTALESSRRT